MLICSLTMVHFNFMRHDYYLQVFILPLWCLLMQYRNFQRDVTAWIGWQRSHHGHPLLTRHKRCLVHLSRRLKCTIVIMRCPSSSSVRRPSVRPSSLTFHIFDFSSETTERNLTKLYRKVDLNVLFQVCVFRADRKNKMAALASDWLRHFRLLLWNC